MPLTSLKIPPGINKEDTDLTAEGQWADGDKVRFFRGQPQKIGGWQKANASTYYGICRSMLPWIDFSNKKWLAFGTHLKFYVYGNDFNDQTPLRSTVTLSTDPFTTVSGSATVTVAHTAHGALNNDFVTFSGAAAVNGITIDGNYQITYVDANSYTITHSSTASGNGSGGGASVEAKYEINTGGVDGVFGLGWGAGTWSSSTWGTARSASNIFIAPRSWSYATWGEDLIINPRGAGIYVWDASAGTGTTNRATLITNAPATANFVLVTPEARHLIAYGAHDGSNDNRLNIRWCSREDYTDWTPTATNTAGDKLIDTGTELLAATHTSREIIFWTDETAYTQQFIGGNEVFAFNHLGDGIGIRGPHAFTEYNDTVFWMGERDFFAYDGQVRRLPCSVKTHVFENLTTNQRQKCVAGVNRAFSEIWFFYPRTSNTEISHYVTYNFEDGTWAIGSLPRTAWVDASEFSDAPMAAGADNYLYDHETGVDADGSAMSVYIQSGDFDMGDGDYFLFADRFIPDFKAANGSTLAGTLNVTFKARRYPNGTQTTVGPFAITSSTTKKDFRMRGRQMNVRYGSDSTSDDWRAGSPRIRVRPDGGA